MVAMTNMKTILCVDDDMSVLTALRTLLTKFMGPGHEIEIAESGDEALEIQKCMLVQDRDLCVVISDFIMPHMRGDELLCKLHECSPRTVKIMLTGQSDLDGVKRAINGANLYRFMEKPFNNADLLMTVKSAVRAYCASGDLQVQVDQLTLDNAELRRELEGLRKTGANSLKSRV